MGMPAAVSTAVLKCSFGLVPATLVALPTSRVIIEGRPAATMFDSAPALNIPPFGMCTAPSNPTVAAATAAAMGVLTPMPCVPVTTPWVGAASRTMIGGRSALSSNAKCTCSWGGIIQVVSPGAVRTQVG